MRRNSQSSIDGIGRCREEKVGVEKAVGRLRPGAAPRRARVPRKCVRAVRVGAVQWGSR